MNNKIDKNNKLINSPYNLNVVRVYSTDDGESHIDKDITNILFLN